MRLEQLQYLIEINKTHSINMAGQNLHTSQQNISKSLQNLEAELGFELLLRGTEGSYLTPKGLIVLKHAQKIFCELSIMNAELAPAKQEISLRGNLRIIYANAFNPDMLYTSMAAFSKANPEVRISIHQKSLAQLLSALYNQEVDLGLISVSDDYHLQNAIEPQKLKSLSIFPLAEDTLLAAVSHLSPLAEQKSISIKKLLKHQLLFLQQEIEDTTTANWLFHLLSNFGTPRFPLTTNVLDLYLKAISDNIGIGFFTQSAKKLYTHLTNNIVFLPIRPSIPLFHGYVLNSSQPISDITAAYLPYLLQ